MTILSQIYRYPVKGLSAEALDRVDLVAGGGVPLDRTFAIAHGSAPFDPARPQSLEKTHFLMLMRNERLAKLTTAYDGQSGHLTILRDGKQVARGDLGQAVGRQVIEQFLAAFLGDEVRGSPRIVTAGDQLLSDVGLPLISLINLASVAELGQVLRTEVHPLRFRGNLYLDGAAPWREFDWLDHEVQIGGARLKVVARTERCAATNVNPETAARDMQIPLALKRAYGHMDMGVYARVVAGGPVKTGDPVTRIQSGSTES